MIASFPMYDRAETQAANDRLWAAVQQELGTSELTTLRRGGDPWDDWTSDDLVLSQTCGYPYRAKLHGKVQLVGTPNCDLDCPAGHYFSVFVVRKDDPRANLSAFDGAVFGYNEAMSQSGWAAPRNMADTLGITFRAHLKTGSHIASARAVADGSVDIAALDALSWNMMQQWDEFPEALRVLDQTPPTPTLPFITSLSQDVNILRAALEAAIRGLCDHDKRILRLKGLVQIPSAAYLAVPTPAGPPD